MIELTPIQLKAKEVLEWLVDTNWRSKATGKTFLLAICFIELAIKNRGTWINVWDHGAWHPRKEEFMLRYIENVLKEHYPDLKYRVNTTSKSFQIDK